MPREPARALKLHGALLAFIAIVALAGCASLEQAPASAPALPPAADLQATASLGATLESLQRLIQGGPAEQAEALAQLRRDYENSPRGGNQLRYALALAAPQHPARDAATAQRLLRELLAAPETLLPFERSLALIELQRVDTELRLVAENARLMAEADRERSRDRGTGSAATAAANRRLLQAELDENARLRKALDDARAKLDAIATIEQNITERKPTTEGRRP
jgi:hypothetical protein